MCLGKTKYQASRIEMQHAKNNERQCTAPSVADTCNTDRKSRKGE